MKNKRNVLYCLIILLTGVVYLTVQGPQKSDTHRANFSGEWKSKEPISMGGNISCVYHDSDRMQSKTMKIAQQTNFLTIEIPNPSLGPTLATSQEKLSFDGKESESLINHGREWGKKFTVKFSADGQTMTVNSIVHFMVPTPSKINVLKQAFFYITEVWNLSNDGKFIYVQANAKSNLFSDERTWKTVFEKAS